MEKGFAWRGQLGFFENLGVLLDIMRGIGIRCCASSF